MEKKVEEVLDVVRVLKQLSEIGRKGFAGFAYYLIVWGGVIGIASFIYQFTHNSYIWIIMDSIGFFLTTVGYAGLRASLIVWIPAYVIISISSLLIPQNLSGLTNLITWCIFCLGLFLSGAISKKAHSSYNSIGLKMATIWIATFAVAGIVISVYSKSIIDVGFIILLFVGIAYIMTGIISTYRVSLTGVVIIIVATLGKLFLSSYFYLVIGVLGLIMLATGIVERYNYVKNR